MAGKQHQVSIMITAQNKSQAQFNQVRTSLGKLKKGFANASQSMQSMLGGLAEMKIGIGIIQGLINPAKNFGKVMAEVSTLVDTSTQSMDFFRDEVKAMAKEIPQTAEQLGLGLYQVLSSGITDSAEAMMVLEVAAKAAVGGVTETETAVDAITTVLNSYGLEASEAGRISDIMFTAVKRGKLRYDELANAMSQSVSTASVAGVSFEELAGALATLTKQGIPAEQAGTALNQVMLGFIKPTDSAIAAAKELGIELNAQTLESEGLIGAMNLLNEAEGDNVEVLAELFPNVRALKGALNLTGDSAALAAEDLAAMEQASKDGTAATEAFDKVNKDASSDLQLYENRLTDVKIAMGENFLPVLLSTLEPMAQALELYQKLPGPLQELIPILIATAAAILIVHGAMLIMSANPVILIILALVVALFIGYKAWQKYGDGVLLLLPPLFIFKKVMDSGILSADNLTKALHFLISPFETLYDWITKVTDAFEDFKDTGIGKVASGIGKIGGGITGAFHPIHGPTKVESSGVYALQKDEVVSPGTSAAGNAPGGGGGKVEININNAVVRRDQDITAIARQVKRVIKRDLISKGGN